VSRPVHSALAEVTSRAELSAALLPACVGALAKAGATVPAILEEASELAVALADSLADRLDRYGAPVPMATEGELKRAESERDHFVVVYCQVFGELERLREEHAALQASLELVTRGAAEAREERDGARQALNACAIERDSLRRSLDVATRTAEGARQANAVLRGEITRRNAAQHEQEAGASAVPTRRTFRPGG
jgi:hypothetical protein